MKNWLLLVILVFTLTGCDKNKNYVFFSSKPITSQTFSFNQSEKVFESGQKINLVFVTQNPFNSNKIRLQVLKVKENVQVYGYTLESARDIEIDVTKNYFISNFYIHSTGYYILRVFSHSDMEKPLSETDFWIK